jgi:DNA repair protein RadD
MKLYPYQEEAISALWDCWKASPQSAPIIVAPTGSGKSFIIATIIQRISAKHPKFRFLVATHTKEIVAQNSKELQALMPAEPIGIYSAGLGEKRIRRITFANVQSVYKKAKELEYDMLIVDECHLLSRDQNSMYQKLIEGLRTKNYRLKIVGLSATPMRMDQGSLIAEGSTFTDIAYDISIRKLIDEGYLCPLTSIAKAEVDISMVSTSGYDFNQKELELAFDREALIDEHCRDIIKHAGDRKHWLVFCTGVKHAKDVAEKFKELGIAADYVTGEMCNWERDVKIQGFKDGKIRALCNVSVLTTGFNFRGIDVVALLRSTKSASLYIQTVGRGTRTAPEKSSCLVLDYGGNIKRHGPIDMIQIKTKKSDKAEIGIAPHKFCPICGCAVPTKTSFCPSCEYCFPDNTKELELKPTSAPILSQVETYEVVNTTIKRHKKMGKPDSFKIEYQCKGVFVPFADYLCFDHGGFATAAAQRKWLARGGTPYSPKTVADAFLRQNEILPVEQISVIKRGKYFEILSVKFTTAEKQQEHWEAQNPF